MYMPPNLWDAQHMSGLVQESYKIIEFVARSCVKERDYNDDRWDTNNPRWKRLLDTSDSKVIWRAINWKGEISQTGSSQPSDVDFKTHFETLLNPKINDVDEIDHVKTDAAPYVPVLDDPVTLSELEDVIKNVNTSKSFTGICPGLLK